MNKLGYKLSPGNLIKNLYISRQKWRQKALARCQTIRCLKWRIRDLELSRAHWRTRALKGLSQVADRQMEEIPAEVMADRPNFHHYALWQMLCCIELYVFSSMGYRAIGQCWLLLSRHLKVATPSFWSVRQWVLRLGLYQLRRKVERARDWVYIVDYTLQMGLEQCLIILGLRLETLRPEECWQLQAHQVQVLDVSLTHWPHAEHIQQRLQTVAQRTGPPVQIVADGAGAIRKGIRLLGQSLASELLYTYDLSHLVARRLKKLLATHPQWHQLVRALDQVQKSSVQTRTSFLAPPSLRKTARYMNLYKVVDWTEKLMAYHRRGDFALLGPKGTEQFLKRFAPVLAMPYFLLQIQQLMDLVRQLLTDFKRHGLSKSRWHTWLELPDELLEPLARAFWIDFRLDMDPFVQALPDENNWLASSDIIESIFGRYKAKGKKGWLKGISPNILLIPALAGRWDSQTLRQALNEISCQDVAIWFNQQRKQKSFLAKRRQSLIRPRDKSKTVGTFDTS